MLKFVHPSIIDLYLTSLEQNRLALIIDGYGSAENWPESASDAIIQLAEEISKKHDVALDAVGSELELARQLIVFNTLGGSA